MPSLTHSLFALALSTTAWSAPFNLVTKDSSSPPLPLSRIDNNGPSSLPRPSEDVKYTLLGLGYQNYSCSTSNTWVQNTAAAGAIASLYDITALITTTSSDSYTRTTLATFEQCLQSTHCTPSPDNDYCATCHRLSSAPVSTLSYVRSLASSAYAGRHFFDHRSGAQAPNFDVVPYRNDFLACKKAAAVHAPADAYPGANGLGAVDWLYLVDSAEGLSHGLHSVYRVNTAGGVAPSTCEHPGDLLQVPYSAEYWLYA
jgi:hypothetical protein